MHGKTTIKEWDLFKFVKIKTTQGNFVHVAAKFHPLDKYLSYFVTFGTKHCKVMKIRCFEK